MDHDDDEDHHNSNPYEYMMPLSGTGARETIDSRPAPHFEVGPGFSPGGRRPKNRRSSNQTDATPRFDNLRRPDSPTSDDEEEFSSAATSEQNSPKKSPIPMKLPLYNVASVGSLDSYAGPGSISSTSTPASLTPTSSKRQFRGESGAMQIGMDGALREVRPPTKHLSRVSMAETIDSQAIHPSRKESRASGNTSLAVSNHSIQSEQRPVYKDDDNDVVSEEDYVDSLQPIYICGLRLPMCCSSLMASIPSLSRIAVFTVSVAPCFWCSRNSVQGGSTGTTRAVLTRLNILTIFITFVQLFAASWLGTLLLIADDSGGFIEGFAPHFWNLNGATWAVGILAFIFIVTCFCTIRVIQEVDLVGAIRYLWLILWLLPFEVFFTVSLFDRHLVTPVWVRHWCVKHFF